MSYIQDKFKVIRNKAKLEALASDVRVNALSSYGGQGVKRTMTGFNPKIDDPNYNLTTTLPDIRGKSRELYNTSAIAKGAIDVKVSNVVGSGLQVESRIEPTLLGITADEAQAKQDIIEKRFRMWAKGNESSMSQDNNFYSMQVQSMRSMLIDGDAVSLLYRLFKDKNRPNQVNPLVIQNVGAHQLCNENNTQDTETMIQGIEIDKHGAPKAYMIVSPDKKWFGSSSDGRMSGTWKRFAKYGSKSGSLNVVHFKNPESRVGQYRGLPCIAPVVDLIKDLTDYSKAELTATTLASMFTVFIKHPTGDITQSAISDFVVPSDSKESLMVNGLPASEKTDADGNQYKLQAGAILALENDESIETASPNRPNTAFNEFVNAVLTEIGMGIGVPFEVLIKKYQSSYSASRAAFLDAWKTFQQLRSWLASQWCQPTYEAWLELEVLQGNIDLKGFLTDPLMRKAWSSATWHGDARGMIDPVKEVNASILMIDNHLSTRERESRLRTGEDWDNTIARDAYEIKKMKELGVIEEQPVEVVEEDGEK